MRRLRQRVSRALVDRLWHSDEPADIARLQAQARLIAPYEEGKWPRRPLTTAGLVSWISAVSLVPT
jgi:hypothetical protein